MNITKSRLTSAVMTLALATLAMPALAQNVQLRAKQDVTINGIQAELRGDYREKGRAPARLNSEIDNINLPIGTKVAFCSVLGGIKSRIGVGTVALVGGVRLAQFELSASDGDIVPKVVAGDMVQARQSKVAPFRTNPGCGAPLLITASFK